MNSTALRAEVPGTNNTHMVFADEEHENGYLKKSKKQLFLSKYYEKLEQARYQDCYHKALIYILGISEDTRKHFSQIWGYLLDLLRKLRSSIKSGYIKTEVCMRAGRQAGASGW